MSFSSRFSIIWWGMCTAIVVVYAIFQGWTAYHVVGALIYAALFIAELYLFLRKRKKSMTWNQRVADGDI